MTWNNLSYENIMKFLPLLLMLLPLPAFAVGLANCDPEPRTVIINNGGGKHTVTLPPRGGYIQEFGPMISFEIKGQPVVNVYHPDEEYCIWSGKVRLQRGDTQFPGNRGGYSLR